jgi:hypothetical protein
VEGAGEEMNSFSTGREQLESLIFLTSFLIFGLITSIIINHAAVGFAFLVVTGFLLATCVSSHIERELEIVEFYRVFKWFWRKIR